MANFELDDDTILVEWAERPGAEKVGIFDRDDKGNIEKSKKALESVS